MPVEDLHWFQLAFPRLVEADAARAALTALNGLSGKQCRASAVLQLVAHRRTVEHFVAVPESRAGAVEAQLGNAVPGLALESTGPPPLPDQAAGWSLWLSTRRRVLETADPERIARRILVALGATNAREMVMLRWVLGPVRRPLIVGSKVTTSKTESWIGAVTAPLLPPGDLDSEARRALRDKQARPGWRALGQIAIAASSPIRQRQLLGQVMGALRTAQAPGAQIGARRMWRPISKPIGQPLRWQLALNVDELIGLSAWPLGKEVGDLKVKRRNSRLLPPVASVSDTGIVLADATFPGKERPLALTDRDMTYHVHCVSPTGAGKSTLLGSIALQSVAAGRGLVLVDPKGDLVNDVLARVPDERLDDVVVIDPTDSKVVGINPLAQPVAPELIADQLLALFKGLFESWGPRVEAVLTAALITLARTKRMSLAALPVLLTDRAFRRRVVGDLDDPLGVSSFWGAYERLSDAEREQVIQPALNRLRPFLLRPQLRAVVGQVEPRFELRDIFSKRRVVLVSLAQGLLGPDVANLLGGLFVSQLWNVVLARQAVPPERRHVVPVLLDEFQAVLHLNTPLADALAQARGMGVSLSLGHQHVDQLPSAIRSAVMANARSRIVWQLGQDDAALMARGTPLLDTEDFTSLGRYEVYTSLVSDGQVSPYMSGRTRPLPPPVRQPAEARARSAERYGVDQGEVERQLRELFRATTATDGSDIGTKRRRQ